MCFDIIVQFAIIGNESTQFPQGSFTFRVIDFLQGIQWTYGGKTKLCQWNNHITGTYTFTENPPLGYLASVQFGAEVTHKVRVCCIVDLPVGQGFSDTLDVDFGMTPDTFPLGSGQHAAAMVIDSHSVICHPACEDSDSDSDSLNRVSIETKLRSDQIGVKPISLLTDDLPNITSLLG